MYRSVLLAGVAAAVFSACAPSEFPPIDVMQGEEIASERGATPPADVEQCDAAEYRGLVGGNIAATTLPTGPRLRAFGVDDIITQDYVPQRTNIVYETDGTIERVYCG